MNPAILIVVENLPVPLDRRVWQEACALRDAGYQVFVICPQMLDHTQPEEDLEGIRIYRHRIKLEAAGFWGFFLEYTSALWGETVLAWRVWRQHQFELIHLCNPPDLLFLVAWPFKLFGVKVVFDVHDLWPEMFEAKFGRQGLFHRTFYEMARLAQRCSYACADVVLATNETNRAVALDWGRKPADRVFLVRTAPKIPKLNVAPDPSLKKGRRFLAGYIGVMGSADGVNRLIDAAGHLVHRLGRTDVQFLLMGTGPEYPKLVKQRDELGLGAFVDMPGWAYDDLLFRALRTIDLGVTCDPPNAYNHSCTMNKVLEYMAFGKAQISSDLKESRASAGAAARFVDDASPAALAEAISRVLNDPEELERMGRVGAERIRTELNWDRSVEQLRLAYETALNR